MFHFIPILTPLPPPPTTPTSLYNQTPFLLPTHPPPPIYPPLVDCLKSSYLVPPLYFFSKTTPFPSSALPLPPPPPQANPDTPIPPYNPPSPPATFQKSHVTHYILRTDMDFGERKPDGQSIFLPDIPISFSSSNKCSSISSYVPDIGQKNYSYLDLNCCLIVTIDIFYIAYAT